MVRDRPLWLTPLNGWWIWKFFSHLICLLPRRRPRTSTTDRHLRSDSSCSLFLFLYFTTGGIVMLNRHMMPMPKKIEITKRTYRWVCKIINFLANHHIFMIFQITTTQQHVCDFYSYARLCALVGVCVGRGSKVKNALHVCIIMRWRWLRIEKRGAGIIYYAHQRVFNER